MLPLTNYYVSSLEKNISNNNGNKRRKKKWPMSLYGGGGGDDLAMVKAAAWAWYLRKEGKPMVVREFDLTRAAKTPRPSRYKIEATKNMILSENKVLAENRVSYYKSSVWYTNNYSSFDDDQETQYSRLLDTYEIKNISKRLTIDDDDYNNLSVSSSGYYDYSCDDDHDLLQKRIDTRKNDNNNKSNNGFMKKVSKRNLWKEMIVMGPGLSTVCGRSGDVDLRASQASRRTVKVAVAAEALVKSTTASGKIQSGRR